MSLFIAQQIRIRFFLIWIIECCWSLICLSLPEDDRLGWLKCMWSITNETWALDKSFHCRYFGSAVWSKSSTKPEFSVRKKPLLNAWPYKVLRMLHPAMPAPRVLLMQKYKKEKIWSLFYWLPLKSIELLLKWKWDSSKSSTGKLLYSLLHFIKHFFL